MLHLPTTHNPPVGFGMLAIVLGTTGLILVFLPVLGVPLSAAGMFFGLLGAGLALAGRQSSLRQSVLGLILCGMALGANVAITFAPAGYQAGRKPPQMWQEAPGRPWAPPPARPQ